MQKGPHRVAMRSYGGATRNRTGDEGFADLCLTAWLWRRVLRPPKFRLFFRSILFFGKTGTKVFSYPFVGADYGARTRHLHLGKVALYQMS